MGFIQKNGLKYYQFDLFAGFPLFHAILTRHGGFSQQPFDSLNTGGTVGDDPKAVLANHHKIFNTFGYDFQSRFDVWQVHGTKIVCSDVPRPLETPHQKADGILTDNPQVTLFMRFADCVPILLYDPILNVIGIVHGGWQGTANEISRIAVEKLTSCYGTDPASILAGIGPSICQDCYPVGPEVYRAFKATLGEQAWRYFIQNDDNLLLDLWQANVDSLKKAGVRQIENAGVCTACMLEDWYSHRGENGKTGRFAVLMRIEDN